MCMYTHQLTTVDAAANVTSDSVLTGVFQVNLLSFVPFVLEENIWR